MSRLLRVGGGVIAGLGLALLLLALPVLATTPSVDEDNVGPDGSMDLIFTGIADTAGSMTVRISCDALTTKSDPVPFANPLHVTALGLPGCTGYDMWTIWVVVDDGATNVLTQPVTTYRRLSMTLDMPLPAVTGQLFTITPVLPADYTAPAGAYCRWEFRWGDNRSLDSGYHDETYGTMLFDVPVRDGACSSWTFNLPWVPYRQYDVNVAFNGGIGPIASHRFLAAEGGTERRITTSTLPIVQILPSTFTPVVGQPVTYTRYLVGGATGVAGNWVAMLGHSETPIQWTQTGGSTFTFTPWQTGDLLVGWNRSGGSYRLGAGYDPPVRYADHTRPNTTAPVARVGTGTVGPAATPVQLTWTGTDTGWGIKTYQLQRSTDGGSWRGVLAAKTTTWSGQLATGHSYRFRVRAIDQAGNVGYWDYGPTFRPRVVSDTAAATRYARAWAQEANARALGGMAHTSSTAGAAATFTFSGRDVAWIGERGPARGKAKVYVDGVYLATVDLTAAAETGPRVVYRRHWTGVATHSIRIVVLATVSRPAVDVDGFVVLR